MKQTIETNHMEIWALYECLVAYEVELNQRAVCEKINPLEILGSMLLQKLQSRLYNRYITYMRNLKPQFKMSFSIYEIVAICYVLRVATDTPHSVALVNILGKFQQKSLNFSHTLEVQKF
jgi:hypothetical protein